MDDPLEAVPLIAAAALGIISFALTLSQISLSAANPENAGKTILPLLENRKKLLGFLDIVQIFTAAFYFFSLALFSLSGGGRTNRVLGIYLTGTLAYVFLFQFFPRRLALNHVEKFSRAFAGPVGFLFRAFGWCQSLIDGFSVISANLFGREPESKKPPLSGEEIKMLVNLSPEEPLKIEREEKEMIQSVMTFGQTMVKEIMTPRIDMVCVEARATVAAVLDTAVSHGYSKFPVYEETIDNIVGIVYLKDLYRFLKEDPSATPLREMMRKPFFVPESKKADDLLREMQRQQISMAVIVDEYGGTDGLVTIEDIVEEIVGEITDERDREIPDIIPAGENTWLADGQIKPEELNEKLELNLPTEEFETLSGYLYGLMGKVPKVGDKVETAGEIFEVMVIHRQRIAKVKLTKKSRLEEEKAKKELF